ncbi:MAG: hypothetical protein ACLR8U_04695 [Oscillospiraceae bacterium]
MKTQRRRSRGICQNFLQANAGGGLQSIGQAMKEAWDGIANDKGASH